MMLFIFLESLVFPRQPLGSAYSFLSPNDRDKRLKHGSKPLLGLSVQKSKV